MKTLIATKKQMSQTFLQDGRRIPVTILQVGPCVVTQIKTKEKDGYFAVQLGYGNKKEKNINKPLKGHLKNISLKDGCLPAFLREVKVESVDYKTGDILKADKVFKPGDIINVTGKSRGKGFTGVMKRWGFHGGPRTHGQSDRQRAPGSIGQATDPGRVFKGKKMAGRSGNATVTIRNLLIVKVEENGKVWIKGQVPGIGKNILLIKKVGENPKFKGLYEEDINPDKLQKKSNSRKEGKKETKQENSEETKADKTNQKKEK